MSQTKIRTEMKIGLSYSRCIRDIVDGDVNIDEVLIIITRTDFNPHDDKQWHGIWEGYSASAMFSFPAWSRYGDDDEPKFRAITIELYDTGRIHQPRQFGGFPPSRSEVWLETVLPNEELEKNPMAKKAWNNFQVIAGLTNVQLDKEYK